MSKITEINPLPKSVEAWGRCLMLHKKRPVYTGKKVMKYQGCFKEEIEAAKSHDIASIKEFGKNARVNFNDSILTQ